MLIWRGYGWLGLVLPLFVGMLINESVSALTGIPDIAKLHRWIYPLMLIPGAVMVWFLAAWLAKRDGAGRLVTDEKTGAQLLLVKPHDCFWIPLKWWPLAITAIGIFMAFPHEEVILTYPRRLYADFETQHRETGLKQLEYKGKATLLMKGRVVLVDESEAGGPALIMHVDDGKTADPVMQPGDPRIVILGMDKEMPVAEVRGQLGKVITVQCKTATSANDRRVVMTGCGPN